jgi:hypothetical protein
METTAGRAGEHQLMLVNLFVITFACFFQKQLRDVLKMAVEGASPKQECG